MLSERVLEVKPSATLEITAKAKMMRTKGIDVVGLGAGEPDFDTPEHIKKALIKALKEKFIYYTPSPGIPELREAIAEKLKKENGIDYSPDEIIVTPGAKQALFEAILALVNPKDEVFLPDPCWVSYEPMVQIAGGKAVFIPTYEEDEFALIPEEVEKKITKKTKALIINSPCNPTGAMLTKKDLKAIADICLEHGIYVISDEIYEKITYGEKHVSIASFSEMKNITITVNGFSKAYSMTGFRLGYAAAPKEIIDGMKKVHEHSVSCATSFVQKAGVAALKSSQKEVEFMVGEFKKRRDELIKMLREIPDVTCFEPKGAFYAFPNFSAYEKDSFKLANYLLEEAKIAVIPGRAFGTCGEGFLRISYATSLERIIEGIGRIKKVLKKWKNG